jgi:putative transposase
VRLIPDGTVLRDQLDRRATSISLLVAIGARADGEKVLLAIRSMGGKVRWLGARCSATWLRGLQTPELLIVDGAPALEKALAALWPAVPLQRY